MSICFHGTGKNILTAAQKVRVVGIQSDKIMVFLCISCRFLLVRTNLKESFLRQEKFFSPNGTVCDYIPPSPLCLLDTMLGQTCSRDGKKSFHDETINELVSTFFGEMDWSFILST